MDRTKVTHAGAGIAMLRSAVDAMASEVERIAKMSEAEPGYWERVDRAWEAFDLIEAALEAEPGSPECRNGCALAIHVLSLEVHP